METIMVNRKQMVNAKNATDLADGVKRSIAQIDEFLKFNDFKLNVSSINETLNDDLVGKIASLSLQKRKELRNHLWRVENRPPIATINRYMHFLMKSVLKSDTRFKIVKSDKQLKIEEARKKYKDALAVAKKAHADYKQEKGDFYNIRLSKNQVI